MKEEIKELAINYAITKGNVISLVINERTETKPEINVQINFEVKHNGIPVDEMTAEELKQPISKMFAEKGIFKDVPFNRLRSVDVLHTLNEFNNFKIEYKGEVYQLSILPLL